MPRLRSSVRSRHSAGSASTRAFEVIVVDDGSRDETPALVTQYEPFVKLVRNDRSQGAGAARNRGVRAARAPVLAFTDSDCFPAPEWLAHGLEAIVKRRSRSGRRAPRPARDTHAVRPDPLVENDGGFYQTANLMVRREAFDTVGGFRDWTLERSGWWRFSPDGPKRLASQRPIGEDTLFAWTACRQGARSAFAPDALVHHAVVPGGVRDAMADRWHWSRDMAALAQLGARTARGNLLPPLVLCGLDGTVRSRCRGTRRCPNHSAQAVAAWRLPYINRLRREAMLYLDGRESRLSAICRAATHVLGSSAVDAATLAGLLAGSISSRYLLL